MMRQSSDFRYFPKILYSDCLTRSLPLPVLTVSKPNVRLLRQSYLSYRWGFAQKVGIWWGSAKGAKYESQGQALSNAKRVAPGSQTLVE